MNSILHYYVIIGTLKINKNIYQHNDTIWSICLLLDLCLPASTILTLRFDSWSKSWHVLFSVKASGVCGPHQRRLRWNGRRRLARARQRHLIRSARLSPHQGNHLTESSSVFINPLMNICFTLSYVTRHRGNLCTIHK